MQFPCWTPKWVINEFEQDFSARASSDETWTDEDTRSRDWLIRIIQAPEAQVVWNTLDKYQDREARLAELASFVWSAHWGFGHVSIKKSEKMKIAKEARRHANAFVECINKLTVQDGFAMNSIVSSFAEISVAGRIAEEINLFHDLSNEPESPFFVPADTIRRAMPAIHKIVSSYVIQALFHDLPYHLQGGLCGSLDKWADRDPEVTKPEHENARRLFFIRSLTSSFVEAYGRPMRKESLALASIFFDCSGLNEASISRLAPVRKRDDSEE